MATIAKRTTRQVRRLYNDQHIQKLLEGTWTNLRIGVLWGYTDSVPTTQVTSNTSVFIGLCAGNLGVLDAAPVACYGIEIYSTLMGRYAGVTPGYIQVNSDGFQIRAYRKEGGTLTRGSAFTYSCQAQISTAAYDWCQSFIVDLNRSTGAVTAHYPTINQTPGQLNINRTVANLQAYMQTPANCVSQTVTHTPPASAALLNTLNIASINEIYPPDFHTVDIRRLS